MWVTSPRLSDRPFTFSLPWHQILGYLKTFLQNLTVTLYSHFIQPDSGHFCICNWRDEAHDVHGNPHKMTRDQVTTIIIIGWVAFFSAWMMNILYYKVHPSDVDFSPRRFRSQMVNLVSLNFVEIIGTNSTSTSLEERECFTLFGRLDATSASVRAIVVKKVH